MVASRPENPDTDLGQIQFPETAPDPINDDEIDPMADFEPGTELVPEKGDFHPHKPGPDAKP